MKDFIIDLGLMAVLVLYFISPSIFSIIAMPFALIIFISDKIQEIFKR